MVDSSNYSRSYIIILFSVIVWLRKLPVVNLLPDL